MASHNKKGKHVQQLPKTIWSTKVMLCDGISISIRTDRTVAIELGKNVLVILSPQEAAELFKYLEQHKRFYTYKNGP